jgi:heterodisulfide reductase subunit A
MVGRALVIGGGAAGLQAAWGLVNASAEVVLAERGAVLGGNLSHNKYLFPLREEAFKVLRERYSELAKSPMFKLILDTEIASFSGKDGRFEATLVHHPTCIDAAKCDLCGECVKACPVEFPDPDSLGLDLRKAVHCHLGIPGGYSIQREKCPPGCRECAKACRPGAVRLEEKPSETTEKFNSVIVATGIVPYDLKLLTELGFGRSPDIITGLEFEIMYRPGGPTRGDILRPSDRRRPGTVAILTCVGSRDEKHRPYCCQVGCMNALNQAYTIKEKLGDETDVFVCFTDVRAHGKYYEEFYRTVRGMQVKFIRGKPSEVMVDRDGSLSFDIFDTNTHKLLKLRPDMIVLEPALVNAAPGLAKTLGIELDREGFFSADTDFSLPVKSSAPGIFLAGTATGPKDVVTTMANASVAAIAALKYMKERTRLTSKQVNK